jgi:hypothetical protein
MGEAWVMMFRLFPKTPRWIVAPSFAIEWVVRSMLAAIGIDILAGTMREIAVTDRIAAGAL